MKSLLRPRLLFVWLTAVLLLASCTPSESSSTGETGTRTDKDVEQPGEFEEGSAMKAIQDRGKLIVGIRLDKPPFAYKDPNTGALAGFDIEVARLIAKGIFGEQIEGKVDFLNLDPRDRELALQQNNVDIAMGRFPITVSAKRFIDFAGPYYDARQDAVVGDQRSSNDKIDSIAQLNGRKVCTVLGSTNYDAVERTIPSADISMELSSINECAAQVTSGGADAIVADHVDLLPLVTQSGSSFEVISGERDFGIEPYGVGVSKPKVDLRKYVNDRLELIVDDDRWEDAYEQTVRDDSAEAPPVDRY